MQFFRIWADKNGDAHHEIVNLEWREVLDYARGLPPVDVTDAVTAGTVNFVRAEKSKWETRRPAYIRHRGDRYSLCSTDKSSSLLATAHSESRRAMLICSKIRRGGVTEPP